MQLTGAQIVMECLKEQAVEYVFGYPGGQIMPIYDALYDYTDSITHILTCHEQGATHAADGYARSTGKVGVCFATSGPGATNVVTGIATAYMDSVPLVVITGQVPLGLIGKDSFQEVDITGITLPVTKHNYFIKDLKDLSGSIREAFEIAKSDRPGPVLIDIPKNLMLEMYDYEKQGTAELERVASQCDSEAFEQIADLINKAKKPVIYAGGGIITSEAVDELNELAQKNQIPVLNTLMGLGSFPRDHELSLGMIGMHGFKEANLAMNNSDLVLAIGARFSDRVTGNTQKFARKSTFIHIDIDESEISKNIKAEFSIIGDI
ncbi:MAG: acetolactate synthase large subunit, partial [Clostridia bacterium]|nr:acetolactate synthase large subunit [Clostridia bacterium]